MTRRCLQLKVYATSLVVSEDQFEARAALGIREQSDLQRDANHVKLLVRMRDRYTLGSFAALRTTSAPE